MCMCIYHRVSVLNASMDECFFVNHSVQQFDYFSYLHHTFGYPLNDLAF